MLPALGYLLPLRTVSNNEVLQRAHSDQLLDRVALRMSSGHSSARLSDAPKELRFPAGDARSIDGKSADLSMRPAY